MAFGTIFVNCATDGQRWLERPPSKTRRLQYKESKWAPAAYYMDRETRIPDHPRPGENYTPEGAADRIHDVLQTLGGDVGLNEMSRTLQWGQLPMSRLGSFMSFLRSRDDLFKSTSNHRLRFAQDTTDYGKLAGEEDDEDSPKSKGNAPPQNKPRKPPPRSRAQRPA